MRVGASCLAVVCARRDVVTATALLDAGARVTGATAAADAAAVRHRRAPRNSAVSCPIRTLESSNDSHSSCHYRSL